jgi:hypothetical protein
MWTTICNGSTDAGRIAEALQIAIFISSMATFFLFLLIETGIYMCSKYETKPVIVFHAFLFPLKSFPASTVDL